MKLLQIVSSITLLLCATFAVELDVTDKESICYAGSLIQQGLLDYYQGFKYGGTIGMFVSPYYWWEAGEAFGGLIDYWFLCENNTYEVLIYDALIAQRGSKNTYIPSNQSTTEGNDDQGFWGIAVMEAAERNFTNPTGDIPGWIALAQGVFNTMWARWDKSNCGGGLRWQIFTWNSGYTYKNTISTACMFNIAARLGRYTGNKTYIDIAEEAFTWLLDVDFIDASVADTYKLYDGADTSTNCTDMTKNEWSYNYGLLLGGAAYAYNHTEDQVWLDRVDRLLEGASTFFNNSIMYEKTCQPSNVCNNDQRSFKSIFARCLGHTSVLVPSTADTINEWIKVSAKAAAGSCSGGTDGHTCGLNWFQNSWDGMYGLGEQMSALEVIQNSLIHDRPAPYTNVSGGTSKGDSSAGTSSITSSTSLSDDGLNITTADKAGSGVITAVLLSILVGGSVWMVL